MELFWKNCVLEREVVLIEMNISDFMTFSLNTSFRIYTATQWTFYQVCVDNLFMSVIIGKGIFFKNEGTLSYFLL